MRRCFSCPGKCNFRLAFRRANRRSSTDYQHVDLAIAACLAAYLIDLQRLAALFLVSSRFCNRWHDATILQGQTMNNENENGRPQPDEEISISELIVLLMIVYGIPILVTLYSLSNDKSDQ